MADRLMDPVDYVLDAVKNEYLLARTKFPPFISYHEAISVIREEYLETEAEIFKGSRGHENRKRIICECRQLAAMAIALLVEAEDCP